MKLSLLFSFALLLIVVGCSQSNFDLAKTNIEKEVKEKMDNPKSYEFVKMDSLTDITKVDSLYYKQKDIMNDIDRAVKVRTSLKDLLDAELYLLAEGGSIDMKLHKENQQRLENTKQTIQEYLNQSDSISKFLGDSIQYKELKNKVIGYKTNFTYKGTNEQGAIVIMKQKVELDKKLKVSLLDKTSTD